MSPICRETPTPLFPASAAPNRSLLRTANDWHVPGYFATAMLAGRGTLAGCGESDWVGRGASDGRRA